MCHSAGELGVPESDDYVAELAAVHVHGLLERDLGGVEVELVVPGDVVLDQCGQEVVRRCHCVDITGEMQIDVPHRIYLGVTSSGGSALDSEGGAQRGLPEGSDHVLPDFLQTLDESDGGDGLTLSRGGGGDGGHEHELGLLALVVLVLEGLHRDLRHILSVRVEVVLVDPDAGSNLFDRLNFGFSRNL